MEIIINHIKGVGGPAEDPLNYLGFEDLSHLGGDCLFFYGGHINDRAFEPTNKPKYFFSTEEQMWDRDTTDKCVNHVDKIFTICPPSITGRQKREYVFFPFNENFIPKDFTKIYDVIYCGAATGDHVSEIVNVLPKYNYKFVSYGGHPNITDSGISYSDKIKLVAQSKITLVHNLTGGGTTQIKTRPFEAAFCKSLIICKKDQWNIIEEWFTPNEEFLYYTNTEELKNIINDVLNNYEKYLPMVEKAHTKALNSYTTRHFIKKYLQ
jgi:hypothetical protein